MIKELVDYLELKNKYYEKFLKITTDFTEQTEQNNWKNLSFFIENRERLLNIIQYFDCKIEVISETIQKDKKTIDEHKAMVHKLLKTRDTLGKRILDLDLALMTKIEKMKSKTIRDLKSALETMQQIQTFSQPKPISHTK